MHLMSEHQWKWVWSPTKLAGVKLSTHISQEFQVYILFFQTQEHTLHYPEFFLGL